MKKTFFFTCLFCALFGFSQQKPPLFIGHRGGLLPNIPENSLMAFQNCIDEEVAMIETDVQLSKDGKMVLFHDASLLRMTGVSKKLKSCTLKELQKLSLGAEQQIPTLEAALSLLASDKIQLLLDIKAGPELDYSELYKLLERYHMKSRVYIGVRSLKDLQICKSLDAKVKVLGFVPGPESIENFVTNHADAIRLWPNWLEEHPTLISNLVNKNIPIWMTVGALSTTGIKIWVQQGVHGFIHDTPKKAATEYTMSFK
ncbi:glycerophosphodiester phosphodiesterase family protein [Wenyingzhuangia sp. 1_MG-2023]|nr:glycerophosphodiester phosphodiesterase family protein [Wenyingzhuangia sp. 1_MG-2023]